MAKTRTSVLEIIQGAVSGMSEDDRDEFLKGLIDDLEEMLDEDDDEDAEEDLEGSDETE